MKINSDEVRNTRHVHVTFEPHEVKTLLLGEVAEALGISMEAAKPLRVDLSDNSTSYVRGDVNLTREEMLQSLGLTPTGPAETDGAAVAAELSHITVESLKDRPVVSVLSVDEATAQVERVVRTLRRIPDAVASVRRHLDVARRLSPDSVDVATSVRIFEEAARLSDGTVPPVDHEEQVLVPVHAKLISEKDVESLAVSVRKMEADGQTGSRTYHRLVGILNRLRPGPAVGPNPGTQVGTGAYAPESEELPEVQVDRTEGLHPLVAEFDELFGSVGMMPDRRERVKVLRASLVSTLAGDVGPLVPRPTTDLLETAREKVKDLYERQYHQGQTPRAKDLVGLYKLLGGGDL